MSCDASGAAYSIPAFRTFFLSTLVWSRGFGSSLSSLRWRCRWTHHGWTLGRKIYQGQQPEDDLKTQQSCQTITVTFNHPVNRLKIGNAYRENQRRQDQRDFFAPACTVRNSKVIIVWCFWCAWMSALTHTLTDYTLCVQNQEQKTSSKSRSFIMESVLFLGMTFPSLLIISVKCLSPRLVLCWLDNTHRGAIETSSSWQK